MLYTQQNRMSYLNKNHKNVEEMTISMTYFTLLCKPN